MDENQVARPRSALLGAAEPVDTGRFSFQDGASGPGDRRSTKKPAYLTPPNSPLTVVRELRRCRLAWRSPPTRSHGGSQGFKSPHLHPQNLAGQSVASVERASVAAFWGRAGAANAHGRVLDVGWGAAAEAGLPSERPFTYLGNDLHSWRLIVLARGPGLVARGSAG